MESSGIKEMNITPIITRVARMKINNKLMRVKNIKMRMMKVRLLMSFYRIQTSYHRRLDNTNNSNNMIRKLKMTKIKTK